jgi:hypothetical protein
VAAPERGSWAASATSRRTSPAGRTIGLGDVIQKGKIKFLPIVNGSV